MKPISIKPNHKGLFTAKANAAGKSVAAFAAAKQNAPGALGKEARFAKNIGHVGEHPKIHTSKM